MLKAVVSAALLVEVAELIFSTHDACRLYARG